MTIKPGDRFPSVSLKRLGESGLEEFDSAAAVAKGRSIVFCIPGAFTGTCTNKHLPSYLSNLDALKAKGVDRVICLAVNDPFVMAEFAKATGAAGRIEFMPDGNGDLARELGMEMDGRGFGLGTRIKRGAMVVDDGVVRRVEIDAPGACAVSTGESILAGL
jgi:peroxiredoxin